MKVRQPGVIGGAEFEERFLRESRAAANLKHEGIVTVHEVGRQDGSIYIVSDFIDGVNLAEWLTGQPRALIGPEEQDRSLNIAELLTQIADALEHAHRGPAGRTRRETEANTPAPNWPPRPQVAGQEAEGEFLSLTLHGVVWICEPTAHRCPSRRQQAFRNSQRFVSVQVKTVNVRGQPQTSSEH